MKTKIISFLCLSVLICACSSDKGENATTSTNIVGIWDAIELNVDLETASDEAQFGSQVLTYLTERNCFIITLQFNEDLTAEATNSVAYLDVGVGATGLTIPCPTESDIETNSYTYANGVVSFVNEEGETVNAIVSVSGDIMTVNAASLEIPNFNESGELIFQRR